VTNVHPRLAGQDRALLFGLVAGLVLGVVIGRKSLGGLLTIVALAIVFGIAYGVLRITRGARVTRSVEADAEPL
jgi:hypothetical protein